MAAACAHFGGVRPVYGPLPGSLSLQLDAVPDAVIVAAVREVRAAGLTVARVAADEGYLETAVVRHWDAAHGERPRRRTSITS